MATDQTPTALDQLAPDVRPVVERATTIVVPVDDGADDALARTRRAAIAVAGLAGAKLVLLDRSDTTYADTPRIFELSREEVAEIDRPYLLSGIDEAAAGGVSATAFQHSLPGDEALTDAVEQVGADLVVVPAGLESPGLFARLKGGDAEERAVDAAPTGVPVLAVAEDGTLSLAT
jgi:nucleotide-binding universal stress UspA family protein